MRSSLDIRATMSSLNIFTQNHAKNEKQTFLLDIISSLPVELINLQSNYEEDIQILIKM